MKHIEDIISIREEAQDYDEMFVIRRQPELVRCRDCKFCKTYYHGPESNLGMITYECIRGLYTVTADDFCSKAERKEE